jgi:hypothetical protein
VLRILHAVRRARLASAPAKAVALALATYSDDTGGSIYPPISDLEADTQLSESTVRRALRQLIADGVLTVVVPATPTTAAVYRLCLDRIEALGRPKRETRRRLDAGATPPPEVSEAQSGGVAVAPLEVSVGYPRSVTVRPPGVSQRHPNLPSTCPETPDGRAYAREGGGCMSIHEGQRPTVAVPVASGQPTRRSGDAVGASPPAEVLATSAPTAEAEPVQLIGGRLVLSPERRTYWLAPNMLANEDDLDLALIQAAGEVQPRGPARTRW